MHQASVDELIEHLETASSAFVRYAASTGLEGWDLRVLEITTGDPPPSWKATDWRYPRALFVAVETSGVVAAEWLRSWAIGADRVPVEFHQNATVERRDSAFTGVFEQLSWPFVAWTLSRTHQLSTVFQEELVAEGMPSFASFDVAAAALLGVPLTGWNVSGREYVARLQDRRGRIERVVLEAASLTATVSGDELAGASVELASERPGPTVGLATDSTQEAIFALPEGLPDGAWLLIKRGAEWLDRRYLRWPYAAALPRGVEIVVPPEVQLEALVSAGEGGAMEFKREMPDSRDSIRNVMKTVAAFANGEGGTILFGVDDDGHLVGLTESPRVKADDQLALLVKTWVHPLPSFETIWLPLPTGDRRVLRLAVRPGERPPYAAGTEPESFVYYVRRGATTFAVMPDEVRALVLARPGNTDVRPYRSLFGS